MLCFRLSAWEWEGEDVEEEEDRIEGVEDDERQEFGWESDGAFELVPEPKELVHLVILTCGYVRRRWWR